MARSKSIPSSKVNRVETDTKSETNPITNSNTSNDNNNKEVQPRAKERVNAVSTANLPEGKAVAGETAPLAVRSQAEVKSPTATETKPAVKSTPESRKLEGAKSDSRKNLVPINLDDEIRRRAYELYEQRGNAYGSETEDWLIAESEILQRYHQRSA